MITMIDFEVRVSSIIRGFSSLLYISYKGSLLFFALAYIKRFNKLLRVTYLDDFLNGAS